MPSLPASILVTGGAGFVGANLCLALAERQPGSRGDRARLAQAPRLGAQPRAAARGRRDVRARRRAPARRPARRSSRSRRSSSARPSRRCWPGWARAPTSSCRRTCSARTTASSSRAATARRSSSSPPAACIPSRRCRSCALREGETRFALEAGAAGRGRLRARDRRGLPARGRAHALRRDEARRRAAASPSTPTRSACRATIDRCGVIAGPWQMGKVDQGVFTHWLLAHRAGGR